eukprot:7808713-Heterocapsa_arctica.AAC.1
MVDDMKWGAVRPRDRRCARPPVSADHAWVCEGSTRGPRVSRMAARRICSEVEVLCVDERGI